MVRNLKDIKRELIYLELNYKLLKLKTLEYQETKEKLDKEYEDAVKYYNKKGNEEEAKNYKPSKTPSFIGKLKDPNAISKLKSQVIDSDDEYTSSIRGDIRL